MQHVAFHVEPEHFDRLVEHVRAAASRCAARCRSAGASGRRTSSTLGTRLELATDSSGVKQSVVESVRQTEEEARAELETLFSDPAEVERWLARMPLRKEPEKAGIGV